MKNTPSRYVKLLGQCKDLYRDDINDFFLAIGRERMKALLLAYYNACDFQADLLSEAAQKSIDKYFFANEVAEETYVGEGMREEFSLFTVDVTFESLLEVIDKLVHRDIVEIHDEMARDRRYLVPRECDENEEMAQEDLFNRATEFNKEFGGRYGRVW